MDRRYRPCASYCALVFASWPLRHNGLCSEMQFWVEQRLRCLDRLPLGLGMTVGRVVCDPCT
ncbi:hypothetical protein BDV09DRAFT_176280 [Aspergillus tetrazonus]